MNSAASVRHQVEQIAAIDADVAQALDQVGYPQARQRPQGFETFLATIVSQQLSTQAAATILRRVHALMPSLSAAGLLDVSVEALRGAGLSMRKVEYARGLAEAIETGDFTPDTLAQMQDEEAIAAITALRGFGRWSAEIYLMFSLQRQDLFPRDDLALRVALQKLKGYERKLTAAEAADMVAHWSPWRSAGSLFLWHFYRGAPT